MTAAASPAPLVVFNGYTPRAPFSGFHARKQRWGVLVVHRRAGKTVAAINDLIRAAWRCKLDAPRFAYIAPTFTQAKMVAWSYLKKFTEGIPGRVVSESELHVTLPGNRQVRLYGADNFDRLRGIYLDGAVVDEPADLDPRAWTDILRPALSDRQGWCVWIGTPKGKDAFYRLWRDAVGNPDWFTMRLPASESHILPAAELSSAMAGMAASVGAYEREYECSFDTPQAGSIYGGAVDKAAQEKRISPDVGYYDGFPVYSVFDIGAAANTKCWLFQVIGDRINFLESLSGGEDCNGPPAWAARLREKAAYRYGAHFLPHDGEILWRQQLVEAGLVGVKVIPKQQMEWDSINDALASFSRCRFNTKGCEDGLLSLESYHTKTENDGVTIRNVPVHDWASHYASAFGQAHRAIRLGMLGDRSAMPSRAVQQGGMPRVQVVSGVGWQQGARDKQAVAPSPWAERRGGFGI